eukprot:19350-Pelagococcus_subviridis.AAC.1
MSTFTTASSMKYTRSATSPRSQTTSPSVNATGRHAARKTFSSSASSFKLATIRSKFQPSAIASFNTSSASSSSATTPASSSSLSSHELKTLPPPPLTTAFWSS